MIHTVKANGAEIPALGLGTWELRDAECARLVATAIDMGYRHIDTAAMYKNEAAVAEGIRASGVPRDDVFLTTKVWPDNAAAGDLQRSVEDSLSEMKLDHVDLILIHWPNPDVPMAETMGALADVKRRGLARHIGISNHTVDLIREAAACSDEPIVTNQVEYHPWLAQDAVLPELRKHGISLTAYAPLARGRCFSDPVIGEIAEAHGKNGGQVALRWLIQQDGVIAIPRSSKVERIAEFIAIGDFALTADEMARISALAEPSGRLVNLDVAPDWD